jgi:excinuclease ABC subunit A
MVRRIDGLGPAVSVAQNIVDRNPNSTVATATGLHPFLRVLYARSAEVSCPRCGTVVRVVSREERLRRAVDAGAVGYGEGMGCFAAMTTRTAA